MHVDFLIEKIIDFPSRSPDYILRLLADGAAHVWNSQLSFPSPQLDLTLNNGIRYSGSMSSSSFKSSGIF